jgi:hypothetical protein
LESNLILCPEKEGSAVKLPPPRERGEKSLEKTIARRRSVREYRGKLHLFPSPHRFYGIM